MEIIKTYCSDAYRTIYRRSLNFINNDKHRAVLNNAVLQMIIPEYQEYGQAVPVGLELLSLDDCP